MIKPNADDATWCYLLFEVPFCLLFICSSGFAIAHSWQHLLTHLSHGADISNCCTKRMNFPEVLWEIFACFI